MTTIYISRHSIPMRNLINTYNASDIEQIRNEKNPLSIEREYKAKLLSNVKELESIDILYSSHYVRAMSTAKYIAENNNILINVDERLGERKFGVNSMSELPKSFYIDQFTNWDYKLPNGESLNEVSNRMNNILDEILIKHKDKRVAIISHGTALSAMLSKYCNIVLNDSTEEVEIYFNNKLIFNGKWNCPELFKLVFNDNKLISIENIKIGE